MATLRMGSMRTVFVPLSERKAIFRLWTDNAIYVNCYDCSSLEDGVCIYDIINDSNKKLCPLKSTNNIYFQCPLIRNEAGIEKQVVTAYIES